jgi:assimilatory nitrate reductase catalytic subunit
VDHERGGKRLGYGAAFAYNSAADIFREHAELSAFENGGSRDFDIGAMASIADDEFDAMPPRMWPLPKGAAEPQPRFFAEENTTLPTARGISLPLMFRCCAARPPKRVRCA